jgi:hypothetical protein
MECCYKVFRADVLRQLPLCSNRFGIEPELVARVAKLGCRIFEVPVSYFGRDYAHGKKITWRDGLAALWHIVRFGLFTRKAGTWPPPEGDAAPAPPAPPAEEGEKGAP